MRSPNVLIVSTVADVATDDVVKRLTARGISHRRLNTEDYPFSATLTFRPEKTALDWLTSNGQPLSSPTSIWYRRLRTPPKPEGMDDGIYKFCLEENRAALTGGLLAHSARWMSHPASVWQAEYKPFQLSMAARLDLHIPRTVVTNDPFAIRTAFAQFGSMVVKPAKSGYVIHEGQEFSIFTSRVLDEHLGELDDARWSPAIYQELIPKRCDVRVTIVGQKVFAAAIDSQSDPVASIDWRHTVNPNLPHRAIVLPENVSDKLLLLMETLHLTFGAIDLIETPAGEYVFLEVNPSGQWLWLDDKLDLGISDAVAEWLAGEDEP